MTTSSPKSSHGGKQLVVIFLNRVEFLEDLMTAFLEVGVSGATVLNSVGMGRIISYEIPIFAGLRDAFPGSTPGNKTILTVVKDEMLDEVIEVLQDICGSFDDPGSGLLFTIPIGRTLGYREEE